MQRVAVVGGPGSGKTTVARALGPPHVELDGLWWEAGWQQAALDVFHARVAEVVAAERWVVEGFYIEEAMAPLVWPRADLVVWLDLPRSRSVARALRRSAARVVRRTELWNGNRQPWSSLTPASIVRFWRRWPRYPETISAALDARPDLAVMRLRSDAEVTRFLAGSPPAPPPPSP